MQRRAQKTGSKTKRNFANPGFSPKQSEFGKSFLLFWFASDHVRQNQRAGGLNNKKQWKHNLLLNMWMCIWRINLHIISACSPWKCLSCTLLLFGRAACNKSKVHNAPCVRFDKTFSWGISLAIALMQNNVARTGPNITCIEICCSQFARPEENKCNFRSPQNGRAGGREPQK